jgi:hypothetical protein
MDMQVLWLVSGMCALTLGGVFWKMKPGFGPNNLQAVGIVLIAFLASVLSILRPDGLNAAMGILGAVGGYLFGMRSNPSDVKPVNQTATTTDSPPGTGTTPNSNQVTLAGGAPAAPSTTTASSPTGTLSSPGVLPS